MKKAIVFLAAVFAVGAFGAEGCSEACCHDHAHSIAIYIKSTLESLEKANDETEACGHAKTLGILFSLLNDARSRDPDAFAKPVKAAISGMQKLTNDDTAVFRKACSNGANLATLKDLGKKAKENEVKTFVTAVETWEQDLDKARNRKESKKSTDHEP